MNKITFNESRLNIQFFKLSVAILIFVVGYTSFAQINDGGSPVKSFTINALNNTRVPILNVPAIDLEQIQAEDEIEDANGMKAPRFGVLVPVQIDLTYGIWNELSDGSRIWRLHIKSEKAKALNLYFDDFYMPNGAKMHIYSPDREQVLGGFGSHNNSDHNMFVTSLIYGDELIIEYYEPFIVRNQGRISISEVNHAYRMIDNPYDYETRDFGDSDPCEVNVNCSEGAGKEEQRDAVARILVRVGFSAGWCSGTVVNNVRQDCTPFFLTALHCADDNGSIASQSDFNQWVFYFNYQGPTCANPSQSSIPNNTITGADIRAHSTDPTISTGSDLLLVEFQNPIPESYNVYYAGWNRGASATTGGYGIHHPAGDIKKISTFTGTTQTTGWNQAGVTHHALQWAATANGHGVTEGGSSGSALFNNQGQVIGTLSGGSSFCTNTSGFDVYGKMSYHWENNTGTVALNQLKTWLDPDNSGAITLNGVYHPCVIATEPNDAGISAITNPQDQTLFCDNPFTPEVVLTNFGTDPLTSVTINYQIDSGTVNTFDWTGSLLSLETETVALPTLTAVGGGSFVFQVYTTLPNGVADADSTNDLSTITAQYDAASMLPYAENFNSSSLPADFFISNPDADNAEWELNLNVNAFPETNSTGGSLVFDNFNTDTRGTIDYVYLPSLEFSSTQGAYLSFDVAYARYDADFNDRLVVLVSNDCRENYTIEYDKESDVLATAPDNTSAFIPTTDLEWRTETVDLSAYDGSDNVTIVFGNAGGYGQFLYVDNINVNYATLSVEEEQLLNDVIVYPNPTSNVINIKSSIQINKVEIYSILGKKILETKETSQINISNFSSGIYLLNIYSANSKTVKRIVIE